YIKEFEADTNLRCHMLLDCSGSMAYGDVTGKFDYARRLAATMAHLAVRQGDAVGMCCFNGQVVEDVPARTGPRHLGAVYDVLEKVEPEGETDLVTVLHDLAERIRRRALVVVISDFFSEPGPLLDCFKHLIFRKHDLAVFHVLDPREMDFDFTRPVRFRDLESSFSMLTDPSVMRRDYMRELKAWLGELRTGCLRYKVDYHQARTSDSVEDVLSAFLLSRMRRK
ncbi:MAG: VWA domain-containing protein, partial [Victivallales bacterium]|nr:VWA domain-containing protein [Victivallales bacterium]